MTGSTRNPQPQAAGEHEGPAGSPEYLDAEEIQPDEMELDDADVVEEASGAEDTPTAKPPSATAEIRAIRTTIDGALESIAAEEAARTERPAPAERAAAPREEEHAPGLPPAPVSPQRRTDPPAMPPPRRTDPPAPAPGTWPPAPPPPPAPVSNAAIEPAAVSEPPVQTPRMQPKASEPPAPPNELPRTTMPMIARPARPSPVPPPPADETTPTGRLALPPPRVPPMAPPRNAGPAGPSERPRNAGPSAPSGAPREDAAPRSQRPGTDPMFRMPQVAAPASAPEPATPRREGTDPMMRIAPAPPDVEPPSEPTGQLRRGEGTDPMMRLAARATGSETTPAIARAPSGDEPTPAIARRREGTDPMMKVPAAEHTPRIAAIPKPVAPPSGSMTGSFAIPSAPEAVLPFRARTGTIPPERPQSSDLAGVLPFRPAGWGAPGVPQNLGEGDAHARTTPADPIPVSQANPAYVPPPAPQGMHAPNPAYVPPPAPQGMHAPNPAYVPPPAPQGAIAQSAQGYAPVPPAQLAPVESASSVSMRRDHLVTGPVAMAPMHEALPFHGGAHPGAPAPSASPSYPAPAPQASYPPVPQPLAQAPAQPAGPPPRPATLPSDSWKLAPAGLLFALAPPTAAQAVQEARMAAAARGAAQAAPPAQMAPQAQMVQQAQMAPQAQAAAPAYPQQQQVPSYAQKPPDPNVVVPASLGQNAPRLSIEQYACMAAELALSPANAAQVRLRYGLDDTAHLAEQGAWQRRFSLDSQLFASYSSLFQHYRDWLNQTGRR